MSNPSLRLMREAPTSFQADICFESAEHRSSSVCTQQRMRSPTATGLREVATRQKNPIRPASLNTASSHEGTAVPAEATAEQTPAPTEAACDFLGLIGAEAFLLEDGEQIKQQRKTNKKIRELLGSWKEVTNRIGSSGSLRAAHEYKGNDVTTADSTARDPGPDHPEPTQNERSSRPAPLPEYTRLPDLPEERPSGSRCPKPLRPWQHEQHQQLLLIQQRQHQPLDGGRKTDDQRGSLTRNRQARVSVGSESQHEGGRTHGTSPSTGAAAIAAAGAAAAAAGADFFGRLHAECFEALRLLRPSAEEERRKKQAAGRVRAVCHLLWGGCSVEVFGSSFTALSLPGSDLDVCVFADTTPPLHDHYACSRCLCCNSSSSNNGKCAGSTSSGGDKLDVSDPRFVCGAWAADGSCCCSNVSKRHSNRGGKESGMCNSSCSHGGPKGFQDLMRAAEQETDSVATFSRQNTIDKIREFERCLRELNQAAALAKRRGVRLGRGIGRFADRVESVVSARVPICKFIDAETGVAVDLSFDQPSAVLTSLYVRHKLKDFALLHPLIVLNKMFLRHWRLHEPFKGGVGSYLLFVMCLHFLQNNPYLNDERKYRHLNLGHLLFHFLHYFGLQFNYEASVISVRGNGSLAPKGQGRWRGATKSREERMMLSAESPLDPSRDLGRSAYKIMQVRRAWREAYVRLASRLMLEIKQADRGSGETTATPQGPLLCCVFGSSTWPKELNAHFPQSSASVSTSAANSSDAGVATPRPGLWIPREVAAETEIAVEGLFESSTYLRNMLEAAGRRCRNAEEATSRCITTSANDISTESDSSEEMKRRPWERKQKHVQGQPSRLSVSKRPNMHVIFDSSESESSASGTHLPVRGFISPPSSVTVGSADPLPPVGSPAAKPVAAPASTWSSSSKGVSDPPTLITVDDSSDSESGVELQHQARREKNRQRRRIRRQRQDTERRKRRKMEARTNSRTRQ